MQYRVLGLYALLGSSSTSTHKLGYNAAQKFCKDLTKHYYYLFSLIGVYEHIRNRQSISDTYPYFDATSERNVTSFVGQVTHLHCTVRDIGDRTVSQ